MRTVGPSPATMAFAAAVFSPILSRRSSRTFTPAARAVAHIASASSPSAIRSLFRKSGRSRTGKSAASRPPNATAAAHAGSGHRSRIPLDEEEPAGDRDAEHGADGEPLGPV